MSQRLIDFSDLLLFTHFQRFCLFLPLLRTALLFQKKIYRTRKTKENRDRIEHWESYQYAARYFRHERVFTLLINVPWIQFIFSSIPKGGIIWILKTWKNRITAKCRRRITMGVSQTTTVYLLVLWWKLCPVFCEWIQEMAQLVLNYCKKSILRWLKQLFSSFKVLFFRFQEKFVAKKVKKKRQITFINK